MVTRGRRHGIKAPQAWGPALRLLTTTIITVKTLHLAVILSHPVARKSARDIKPSAHHQATASFCSVALSTTPGFFMAMMKLFARA